MEDYIRAGVYAKPWEGIAGIGQPDPVNPWAISSAWQDPVTIVQNWDPSHRAINQPYWDPYMDPVMSAIQLGGVSESVAQGANNPPAHYRAVLASNLPRVSGSDAAVAAGNAPFTLPRQGWPGGPADPRAYVKPWWGVNPAPRPGPNSPGIPGTPTGAWGSLPSQSFQTPSAPPPSAPPPIFVPPPPPTGPPTQPPPSQPQTPFQPPMGPPGAPPSVPGK